MQIGIILSRNIGATVARLSVQAGHDVALANSRGPTSLERLVAQIGDHARPATVDQAARFGELVLIAIPFGVYRDLPRPALAGKTVVDATNYYPARDGDLPELNNGNTTSSELLAAYLPEAHVIKAFNTMYYETLATGGQVNAPHEQRLALFIAGDDDQAKRTVAALIRGCRHRFARSRRRAPATWKRYLQPATQRS